MTMVNQWVCTQCMRVARTDVCEYCGAKAEKIAIMDTSEALPCETELDNGRYRIGRPLGQGGFGITYKARDLQQNRIVAVKEFFPSNFVKRAAQGDFSVILKNDRYEEIFRKGLSDIGNEVMILKGFSNLTSTLKVYGSFSENNTSYIVMQLLEGKTVGHYIQNDGKVSCDNILRMMRPLMLDLAEIHSKKLIHRDISPNNIIIDANGKMTLFDFGSSRPIPVDDKGNLTVMIHKGYAPIEQYDAKGKQGAWTDIYALCATIYYAITRVEPDDAEIRNVSDTLKTPSELGIQIEPYVERALIKGMSIKAEDRYRSMEELINDLYPQHSTATKPGKKNGLIKSLSTEKKKKTEKAGTRGTETGTPSSPTNRLSPEEKRIKMLKLFSKVFIVLMPPFGIAAYNNIKKLSSIKDEAERREMISVIQGYLLISAGIWAMGLFVLLKSL